MNTDMKQFLGLNERNCTDVRGLAERAGAKFFSLLEIRAATRDAGVIKEIDDRISQGASHIGVLPDGSGYPAIL